MRERESMKKIENGGKMRGIDRDQREKRKREKWQE